MSILLLFLGQIVDSNVLCIFSIERYRQSTPPNGWTFPSKVFHFPHPHQHRILSMFCYFWQSDWGAVIYHCCDLYFFGLPWGWVCFLCLLVCYISAPINCLFIHTLPIFTTSGWFVWALYKLKECALCQVLCKYFTQFVMCPIFYFHEEAFNL